MGCHDRRMADYPQTRRDDVVDVLHGRPITDPYRWLEDPDSAETADWVKRQNEVTEAYLEALPERGAGPEAEELGGARGVERASGLAVRHRGVPGDLALETGHIGDRLGEFAN